MKFGIRTYNAIHSSGLELFSTNTGGAKTARTQYTVSDSDDNPDAIICRSASLHDIAMPSTLRAIARAGTGVNNIPVEKCTENGIVVFNTLGANANAVKELVFAGMLSAARNLTSAYAWTQTIDSNVGDVNAYVEKNKKLFSGTELQGKTLGVIGLGAVGHKVANLGIDFDMQVLGYDPFLSIENALSLSNEVEIVSDIVEMLARADFISLHVGYNDATRHLINAENLSKCKAGLVLLNFARAQIVEEEAVLRMLTQNKLGKYVSDFPSLATISVPNVIAFPHLGASTEESEENCAILAARAIKAFLEKGSIVGSVNFPNCKMSATVGSKCRLLVGNKNIANIVAQITQILGTANANIEDMINTHRTEIAYNIIDIDTMLDADILKKIKAIQGVLFAHSINL